MTNKPMSMQEQYAAMALRRLFHEQEWTMLTDFYNCIKPTRMQRLKYFLRYMRVKIAKFIAGKDWPDDY